MALITTYEDEDYNITFARAGGRMLVEVFKFQKNLAEEVTDNLVRMEAMINIVELLVKDAHVNNVPIDAGDLPIPVMEEVITKHPTFRSGS